MSKKPAWTPRFVVFLCRGCLTTDGEAVYQKASTQPHGEGVQKVSDSSSKQQSGVTSGSFTSTAISFGTLILLSLFSVKKKKKNSKQFLKAEKEPSKGHLLKKDLYSFRGTNPTWKSNYEVRLVHPWCYKHSINSVV